MATLSREQGSSTPRTFDAARLLSSGWALVPILLAALIVYAPTLNDWFSGDDFWFLRAAQTHSVGSEIARSLDFRNVGTSLEFDRYRPLYPIVWRLQYELFGLHAGYYHAVVVGLHLACTATVWFIARRLFRESWASNLAALIFALHPAYMDAIAWISGGNRVFVALPYLLAMLYFMKSCDNEGGRRGAWLAMSFVLFVVAVGFHSSAMTLAAVLPVYAFVVAGKPRDALDLRAWLRFVPFFAVVGVSTAIQTYVRANLKGGEQAFRFGYHQYANYGGYLGMAVQPIAPENFSGTLRTLLEATRGFGSFLLLALSVAVFARRPLFGAGVFAAFWFLVALLPDSTLILGPSGRALYLPGAPLALLIVALIVWARDELPAAWARGILRAAPFAIVGVIALTMFVTYHRTRGISTDASRNDQFITRLRQDLPTLPAGTLYVANPPSNLTIFNDTSRLDALVELYYGDAQVQYVAPALVSTVEANLKPDDRLYVYKP